MFVGMLAAARSVHKTLKLYEVAAEADSRIDPNPVTETRADHAEENHEIYSTLRVANNAEVG